MPEILLPRARLAENSAVCDLNSQFLCVMCRYWFRPVFLRTYYLLLVFCWCMAHHYVKSGLYSQSRHELHYFQEGMNIRDMIVIYEFYR